MQPCRTALIHSKGSVRLVWSSIRRNKATSLRHKERSCPLCNPPSGLGEGYPRRAYEVPFQGCSQRRSGSPQQCLACDSSLPSFSGVIQTTAPLYVNGVCRTPSPAPLRSWSQSSVQGHRQAGVVSAGGPAFVNLNSIVGVWSRRSAPRSFR